MLDQIVLVGQRDLDSSEVALIEANKIPHIKPGENIAGRLKEVIAGRAVYVHLDCDVLNPGIVPTDYVHEGGLSLEDLKSCCNVIAAGSFLGIEIAEFQYSWEPSGEPVSPSAFLDALSPLLSR